METPEKKSMYRKGENQCKDKVIWQPGINSVFRRQFPINMSVIPAAIKKRKKWSDETTTGQKL